MLMNFHGTSQSQTPGYLNRIPPPRVVGEKWGGAGADKLGGVIYIRDSPQPLALEHLSFPSYLDLCRHITNNYPVRPLFHQH